MATSAAQLKVMKKLVDAGYTNQKKISDLSYRSLKAIGLNNSEMDIYEQIANNCDSKNFVKFLFTDDKSSSTESDS